mgnify:CR=1 FL=1
MTSSAPAVPAGSTKSPSISVRITRLSGAIEGSASASISAIVVGVPALTVLSTEVFDRFLAENDLHALVAEAPPDERLALAFGGPLTSLRSALVRRDTLARFASRLSLGQYLLMGHGEAESGGRDRPATLCATFEALVGALHLDQGLGRVVELLEPLIIPEIARILEEELHKDSKSRLQELAQGLMRHTPRYATVSENGPDHAKEFTVQVTIGGRVYGQGKGLSKQQAAQAAAVALGAEEVNSNETVAKVSVVGVAMARQSGVAHRMFRALAEEGINIQMISTSEIKISVVVDEKYLELAVRVLHKTFELEQAAA